MKTFIFSLLLVIACLSSFAQTATVTRDSAHQFQWLNGQWNATFRYAYTYDAAGRLATEVTKTPDFADTSIWHINTRNRYDYTAYDSLETRTTEFWNSWDSTWSVSGRMRRAFSATHQLDSAVSEYWDGMNWSQQWRTLNTYNAADLLATSTRFEYTVGNTIWKGTRELFAYTAAGAYDTLTIQNWDTAAHTWLNINRMVYQYLPSGKLSKTLNFDVDSATQAWILTSESVYAYTPAGEVAAVTTREDMGDGILFDALRLLYTYNAQGQVLTETSQFPNFFGAGWLTTSEITYTYDANGHRTRQLVQGMGFSGGLGLENYEKTDYFWNFHPVTGVEDNGNRSVRIVMLNPAQPGSPVRVEGAGSGATIALMTPDGKTLAAETLTTAETALPQTLAAGWYLVQVRTTNGAAATTKVLVLE